MGTRYEVWLPDQEEPEASFVDGDKAARYARENGGVMVQEGASEEDVRTLLEARFPAAAPSTSNPGLEVALSQARHKANREALEEAAYDSVKGDATKAAKAALKEAPTASKEDKAQAEAVRISMTEPERDAGGEPSPLPAGSEATADGGVIVGVGASASGIDTDPEASKEAADEPKSTAKSESKGSSSKS